MVAELEEVGKPGSQSLLYRAARELLTNVGKHAGAEAIPRRAGAPGDRVILTVTDDGRGFDPEIVGTSLAAGHIGLGSLLARFDAMGGSMRIESHPGQGTRALRRRRRSGEPSRRYPLSAGEVRVARRITWISRLVPAPSPL